MASAMTAFQDLAAELKGLEADAPLLAEASRLEQAGQWLDEQLQLMLPWLSDASHIDASALASSEGAGQKAGEWFYKSVWTLPSLKPSLRSAFQLPMVRIVSLVGGNYAESAWKRSLDEPFLDATQVVREPSVQESYRRWVVGVEIGLPPGYLSGRTHPKKPNAWERECLDTIAQLGAWLETQSGGGVEAKLVRSPVGGLALLAYVSPPLLIGDALTYKEARFAGFNALMEALRTTAVDALFERIQHLVDYQEAQMSKKRLKQLWAVFFADGRSSVPLYWRGTPTLTLVVDKVAATKSTLMGRVPGALINQASDELADGYIGLLKELGKSSGWLNNVRTQRGKLSKKLEQDPVTLREGLEASGPLSPVMSADSLKASVYLPIYRQMAEATKGTTMRPDSTSSRIKKWRLYMCLVR